jgi:hypothetical protein
VRDRLIWVVGGLVVLLFLCFVWPTRYIYFQSGEWAPFRRVDRITGRAQKWVTTAEKPQGSWR